MCDSFLSGEARVDTLSMNTTVYTTESVLATCSGTGFPQSSIIWTHNGQPLENSSRVTIYENTTEEDSGLTYKVLSMLEVCSVRTIDGGVYECIVANRLVNNSANFMLTVRGELNVTYHTAINFKFFPGEDFPCCNFLSRINDHIEPMTTITTEGKICSIV